MRKISRFIQLIDPKAFHAIQRTGSHDERAKRARLIRPDNNELQLTACGEGIGTSLDPGVLMHWAVDLLGDEVPPLGLVFDSPKLLDNPHGSTDIMDSARKAPNIGPLKSRFRKTWRRPFPAFSDRLRGSPLPSI